MRVACTHALSDISIASHCIVAGEMRAEGEKMASAPQRE